jgi:hypothetical protein
MVSVQKFRMTEDREQQGGDYYEEQQGPHDEFKSSLSGDLESSPKVKVEHGVVINLPLANLLKRKVHEVKECYLVLHEKFVRYKIIAKYEIFDDTLEQWVDNKCNFRWVRMRADITDIAMSYDNTEHLYSVEVEFGRNMQTWHFEKGADAKRFFDVMQNYLVTRDYK